MRRTPGAGEIVENIALVKEFSLVGVQIFRHGIRSHRATAKGDHLFPRGQDREHDAIAKPVIGDRYVLMHHQPAGLHLFLRHALACQMLFQRITAIRRITEPKGLDGAPGQPAIAQVSPRPRAKRRLQLVLKEQGRHFHDVLKRGPLALALFRLRIGLRHGNAGHIGDLLHGLRKTQTLKLRQKTEMVARNTTAKAMVAALTVLAVKARAFLAMERAAGPIIPTRRVGLLLVPGHTSADHIGDVHAVAYLIEERIGKAHGLPVRGQSFI
ncbi:hypothetical protein D3C80_301770 [compost metagenome]